MTAVASRPVPAAAGVAAGDVVLAVAVAAMTLLGTAQDLGAGALDVVGGTVLVVGGLGLVVHRRRPTAAFVTAVAAQTTYHVLGYPETFDWLATTVALGSLTAAHGWRRGVPLVVVLVVMSATEPTGPGVGVVAVEQLLVVVGLACAVAVGEWLRTRRAYLAAVEERAAALERSRQEEARRLVDAERLRIAREVHDVVAHAMASISVQAGVGAHLAGRDPGRATDALAAIRRASGEALDDLRGLVGALRLADAQPAAPGLADLDAVVATARDAGVQVDVRVDGPTAAVPADVGAAAFRIVQEGVTNALRHGRGDRIAVAVAVGKAALDVTVADPGPPRAPRADGPAGGHGIRGMRERAALLGGWLTAGPAADGVFVVRAHLPIPQDAP